MVWIQEGLCILPGFLIIWCSITFAVSYLIGIYREDVDVLFPYISDTGASPPESCLFSFMATISAFAGLTTMYARYKFVQKLIENTGGVSPRLNFAALFMAIFTCVGMCLAATFQETAVETAHDIGAIMFFIFGLIYIILQTIISYKAHPYGTSKNVCHIRAVFSFVALLAVITTIVCVVILKRLVQGKMHWQTEDQGYQLHIASAVSEWIAAFTFVFFFFTYIHEFKQFTLQVYVQLQELT